MATPKPVDIALHQAKKILEVKFDNNRQVQLTTEYLRVSSPSAEVKGHGPGQEVLQVGKKNVNITAIEPVGNYAIRLKFDDGHDTGIYTWDYLYELTENQEQLWQDYLDRLQAAGMSREQ